MADVTFFRDSNGNFFIVCDVAALGDCAVLDVLSNPNFKAPLCTVQELHHAVVSFAQGTAAEECSKDYTVLKGLQADTFDVYLQQVLQPRFWVGTEFFVWLTMMYGIEIIVHFFSSHKEVSQESTLGLLKSCLPDSTYLRISNPEAVHVFFSSIQSDAPVQLQSIQSLCDANPSSNRW